MSVNLVRRIFRRAPRHPRMPPLAKLRLLSDGFWEGQIPLGKGRTIQLLVAADAHGPTEHHIVACTAVLARLPELEEKAQPELVRFTNAASAEQYELEVVEFGKQNELERGVFSLVFSRPRDPNEYNVRFDGWAVRGVRCDDD